MHTEKTMEMTDCQVKGLEFLHGFVKGFEPIGCLQGYAGVGKTWLVGKFLGELLDLNQRMNICVAAPTHKALDVLRGKCGHLPVEFKTVASLLGQHISRNEDGELMKGEVPREWEFDLYVIDEGSMVNLEQCQKLEAKGWKILYVGDPAQLPPVGELKSPAFEYKNKFLMTTVVRQEADNPVTGIATMLRGRIEEGAGYTMADIGAFAVAGDRRLSKVTRSKLYNWALDAHAKGLDARILAYTNQTVNQHNATMHKSLYPEAPLFGVGEKVLVNDAYVLPKVSTDPDEESEILTNGTILEVISCTLLAPQEHGVITYEVRCKELGDNGHEYTLPVALHDANAKAVHKMLTEKVWALRKKIGKTMEDREELKRLLRVRKPLNLLAPLRHSYACTVHKSQGSTYDLAFVDFADMYRSDDRTKLMYVAVTRTSKWLVMVD
jgi:exodeoxyribonuclease-5